MPTLLPASIEDIYSSAEQIASVSFAVAKLLSEAAKTREGASYALLTVCATSCEWLHNEAEMEIKGELDRAMLRRL